MPTPGVDQTQRTYRTFTPNTDLFSDRYKGLAQNNPYATPSYRKSWWQNLLTKLGFRTNYDTYLESLNLQAQEYENSLLQKQYDENYNSPLEQANREREAGLNPNLTGNISSGEAAPLPDDGNPPIAPEADDLDKITGFAGAVLEGVQAAFGLYGNIQSINQLKINNESSMMNLVKSAWSMIIPDIYENRNDLESGRVDVSNYYNTLKKHFGHTMSKKKFDSFVNRVNSFANSAEGWSMVYDTQSKKAKARKSMFSEIGGEGYSEWDDIMTSIGDVLGDLAYKVNKRSLENDKYYQENVRPEELQNKEYYEQALDPTTMAKLDSNPDELKITENQATMSDLSVDQAKYSKLLRSSFQSIMQKLEAAENKGNKVAPIVKAVLSVWLMGLMPSMPSITKSSRSGVGLNGTPYSQSSISVH